MDVFACWLFASQASTAPVIIDIDELREARVPDYTNEILARVYRYKHINANQRSFVIGVKAFQVLMVERADASWKQLQLSPIFDGIALHALLDEFASILSVAQFPLPAAFAISPVRTLC